MAERRYIRESPSAARARQARLIQVLAQSPTPLNIIEIYERVRKEMDMGQVRSAMSRLKTTKRIRIHSATNLHDTTYSAFQEPNGPTTGV